MYTSTASKATQLSPAELMARPLQTSGSHVPKLFHQSWSTTALPAKFEQWSRTCREMNADFEWVLWTDKDNRRLVERYAPDFLLKYDGLKSEIYRADAVRNLYMFVFGGVYADLDTECLRPYEALFTQHYTSLSPQSVSISLANTMNTSTTIAVPTSTSPIASSTPDPGTAFLARMGNDYSKKHSIPNAWMASTPSHPFWLLPLNLVAAGTKPYGDWPEAVTGPDALFHLVNRYLKEYDGDYNAEARLDEFLRRSEMKGTYVRFMGEKDPGARAGIQMHQMVLLGREMIFPYWWGEKRLHSVCKAGAEGFDPETCKDVLDVQALSSWSITYWSHSWKQEGGHDEGQLSALENWIGFPGRKHLRSERNMIRKALEWL
ncbi:MAG: hypothetical protein ASARMPRED_005292 [Alectoria sarmentosa]|nr:MAG: hypothetical protein ASARMPRED_005292 [Alectoria sarmentosa]